MDRPSSDIEPVPESKAFKEDIDSESLVDFEIAFFMVILTAVLAYPDHQSVLYQVVKLLMVLFASLTVMRRIIVMRGEDTKFSRFMVSSLAVMVEISIAGMIYMVYQLSLFLEAYLFLNSLWWFFIICFVPVVAYALFQAMYDQDGARLFKIVVASWEANTAQTSLWRKWQRNSAIKSAKKIDRPDDELPDEVVQLRQKETRRILPPIPGEIAQFLHGALLWLLRRPISVFWGWMLFGSLMVSLLIYVASVSIGSLTNMLYKRYGAGEFYHRIGNRRRIILQNLTVLYAHFLILF